MFHISSAFTSLQPRGVDNNDCYDCVYYYYITTTNSNSNISKVARSVV